MTCKRCADRGLVCEVDTRKNSRCNSCRDSKQLCSIRAHNGNRVWKTGEENGKYGARFQDYARFCKENGYPIPEQYPWRLLGPAAWSKAQLRADSLEPDCGPMLFHIIICVIPVYTDDPTLHRGRVDGWADVDRRVW